MDVINGAEFNDASCIFKVKQVELKKMGKAKVEHKPPIAQEDLKKLYRSEPFDVNTPTGLQNKVGFEIMLFFCRQGQENLRELQIDASGRKYVYQKKDELKKNRREDSDAE